jgi:hypothetical protein
MPELILGPLLRYAGEHDATIWVETDSACEVEVLGHRSRTFHVEGHHYAIVHVAGLEPGESYEYGVALDGEKKWPEPESEYPPSVIRTIGAEEPLRLVFGSCRLSLPHEPPYTLGKEEDECGFGPDALYALVARMLREPWESWPDVLLMLGDQIYADELPTNTREFIRARRDTTKLPGEEAANFEEYTHLYKDSWTAPPIRWLFSTVPSAMIFDDHELTDDWNISEAWIEQRRLQPWWNEQIVGGYMSYWIYQHLGNLAPEDLKGNELLQKVKEAEDAGPLLRQFAFHAERDSSYTRWSFCRDFGKVRLLVVDSRAGRVLEENRRSMLDDGEWAWLVEHSTGEFDHLLIGTSLPVLMGPGMHYFGAWNEAICKGAWGTRAAKYGEQLRQSLDLEHWSAFQASFEKMIELLRAIGSGERGRPPNSITVLSGDVHHGYLAELELADDAGVESAIYQAVSSPLRQEIETHKQRIIRVGWSRAGGFLGRLLARSAGVGDPAANWCLTHDKLWFDNHLGTLVLQGNQASLKIEQVPQEDSSEPHLQEIIEHRLV